jgi:hypothetical protein
VRASETDRTLICPASLVLPRTQRTRSEKTNRAAAFGTLAHHFVETGETDPAWGDPRDIQLLEEKILLSGIRREDYWRRGRHEVTFAIHLPTETVYEYGVTPNPSLSNETLDRDEWKLRYAGPEYLTGTIDYLYDDGSVTDLKTGSWEVNPETSKQLRSYGLFPWLKAGKPLGWDRVLSIDTWKKYPKHALPTRSGVVVTGFELMDHLEDLKWAATHPGEVVPGDEQCRFCDCKPNCPAWKETNEQEAAERGA